MTTFYNQEIIAAHYNKSTELRIGKFCGTTGISTKCAKTNKKITSITANLTMHFYEPINNAANDLGTTLSFPLEEWYYDPTGFGIKILKSQPINYTLPIVTQNLPADSHPAGDINSCSATFNCNLNLLPGCQSNQHKARSFSHIAGQPLVGLQSLNITVYAITCNANSTVGFSYSFYTINDNLVGYGGFPLTGSVIGDGYGQLFIGCPAVNNGPYNTVFTPFTPNNPGPQGLLNCVPKSFISSVMVTQ